MPVFISYSHDDSEFVDKLALNLVQRNVYIWLDKWELSVGDSLLDKIQAAITEASALIIILSKSSVKSGWVRKELNAGLVRELDEKRVIVLPLLLEDCEIPMFLKEKMYADFRNDFDKGLQSVSEAIAKIISPGLGRFEQPEFHIDWSYDWGLLDDGSFAINIYMVEQAQDQPYSVFTTVRLIANNRATEYYDRFEKEGLGWVGLGVFLEQIAMIAEEKEMKLRLVDQFAKKQEVEMSDLKTDFGFLLIIESRRMGEDTGKDILIHYGGQLIMVRDAERAKMRKATPVEMQKILSIMREFRVDNNTGYK
jgi:hypothetical protein